jgi:hypothetical protein
MKPLFARVSMAAFTLASVFAAAPVLAGHVLDFQVLGRGSVISDCVLATTVNCTVELGGQASGTHIGHDDFNLQLRVTGLGQRLTNGDIGGLCVVVHGWGTLTPPSTGTSISFNVAGTLCEEGGPGSPAHFDGTYRITGGTARFTDAVGGGSLTATYVRNLGGEVFLHLHGVIR